MASSSVAVSSRVESRLLVVRSASELWWIQRLRILGGILCSGAASSRMGTEPIVTRRFLDEAGFRAVGELVYLLT